MATSQEIKDERFYPTDQLWAALGKAKGDPASPIRTYVGIAETSGRSHATVANVFAGRCADLKCLNDVAATMGFKVKIEIVPDTEAVDGMAA